MDKRLRRHSLFEESIVGLSGFGVIYITDATAAQPLSADTPVKLTLFESNGIYKNTIPDAANHQIIVEKPGIYEICGNFSFEYSLANAIIELHPALNGEEVDPGLHRKIGTAGDVGAGSFGVLLQLSAGDIVSVTVESSGNGNIIIEEASLIVKRID